MKSHFSIGILCILILTSCFPATPDNEHPAKTTPTDAPVSETLAIPTTTNTPVIPTATETGLFNITEDFMVIQQGNDAPAFKLQTAPSWELADNHIGVWWEDYGRYNDPDHIYSNGFTRTRIGSLGDWGAPDQGYPITKDTLLPRVDDLITQYAENGIIITLPTHVGSGVPPLQDDFTQEEIDTILEFTAFVAEHFKGRIAYYEIWNEFGHTEKIDTYINLVEQSTALIKEINPDAKVVVGSVPGDWLNNEPGYGEYQRFVMSTRYMNALIDGINFREVAIDGISWHPIYDNIPEDPYYQNYPQLVQEIQARASAKGFTGEYFADEILWHTVDEENWDNGPPVSKAISAKYYLRTITEHRGLGVNVTINTFFQVPEMDAIRNLNNILAGAEPYNGIYSSLDNSAEIQYLRQYAFILPNGDILLAIWRNGTASEDDIGIPSTLTIADISASSVTGINVLNGFEQELIAETADNDIVIHNLMLKDYPLFIKIVGSSP